MNKETLYLEVLTNSIREVKLHEEIYHKENITNFLNECCLKELTTLQGRIDAIRYQFKIIYNVPIYINDDVILLKFAKYYINYCNIDNIKSANKQTIINLRGKTLIINKSYRSINALVKKVEQIIHYKNGFI